MDVAKFVGRVTAHLINLTAIFILNAGTVNIGYLAMDGIAKAMHSESEYDRRAGYGRHVFHRR